MKNYSLLALILLVSCLVKAETARPTWELGKNPIDPKLTKGQVDLVDGVVKLDGTNTFSLPKSVLGDQNDYTIEFEVKRPVGIKKTDKIMLVSNTDEKKMAGLGLRYFPPAYNCAHLLTNGHMTVEYRGFLHDKFDKITLVAKDKQLMMFRNGLLLATTDDVKSSDLPLAFGTTEKEAVTPFEFRNIKIYDSAMLPTGFDPNAKRMRYVSGDQYFMQRVHLDDPSLPRVLIIGDSISMGYRPFITKMLEEKANVDYWTIGFKSMQGKNSPMERALIGVLSNGPYDVVTFNFGLHYWTKPQRSPEDKHVPWYTKIAKHLKKTSPNTKFLWMRTTPCTKTNKDGSVEIDMDRTKRLIKFNEMTDKIMKAEGITEVDLYDICAKNLSTASRDGIHWKSEGSKLMAEKIVKEIETYLPEKKK